MSASRHPEFRVFIRGDTVTGTYNGDLTVPDVRTSIPTPPSKTRIDGLSEIALPVLKGWVERDLATREELRLLGCYLYQILFPDDPSNKSIRTTFEAVYRAVDVATDVLPLRLVLEFDDASDELAHYPWEYLYLPDYGGRPTGHFFGAWGKMVLSRHVELKGDGPVPERDTLRLLAVVSTPHNLDSIVAEPVITAIEGVRKVALHRLDTPTKGELETCITQYRPHAVHLFAHGQLTDKKEHKGHGEIALKLDESPRARWVLDTDLADMFSEWKPRLVFLHACEGAASGSARGFQGAALQLVKTAVPAVIAMGYEITNDDAKAFACAFYEQLAGGSYIDVAVQQGRAALAKQTDPNYSNRSFGTPVIYLQSRDYRTDHRIIGEARTEDGPANTLVCPFGCGPVPRTAGYCPMCKEAIKPCPQCHEHLIPYERTACADCDAPLPQTRARAGPPAADLDARPSQDVMIGGSGRRAVSASRAGASPIDLLGRGRGPATTQRRDGREQDDDAEDA